MFYCANLSFIHAQAAALLAAVSRTSPRMRVKDIIYPNKEYHSILMGILLKILVNDQEIQYIIIYLILLFNVTHVAHGLNDRKIFLQTKQITCNFHLRFSVNILKLYYTIMFLN